MEDANMCSLKVRRRSDGGGLVCTNGCRGRERHGASAGRGARRLRPTVARGRPPGRYARDVTGAFVHRLRVRYSECDPQGVVFNAHYVTYFDIALTELWREAIGPYTAMTATGTDK